MALAMFPGLSDSSYIVYAKNVIVWANSVILLATGVGKETHFHETNIF